MTYGGMDDCVAAGGPHLVANSWCSLRALSSLTRPPDLHTSSSQSRCASCHAMPPAAAGKRKNIPTTLLIDVKPRTPLKADRRQRALSQTTPVLQRRRDGEVRSFLLLSSSNLLRSPHEFQQEPPLVAPLCKLISKLQEQYFYPFLPVPITNLSSHDT